MCGTIDPGSCIRWVLDFGIKTGYDSVQHEEGSSSKGIYVLLSFLWQPTVESLGEFSIFRADGWEICHETMIALPCLGESSIRKLLEPHPQISLVSLLADLSDEKSQKSHRYKSQRKPREWVVNYRWLGSNKTLPCDHHKQPQGSGLVCKTNNTS
jgi:hypothetical protein